MRIYNTNIENKNDLEKLIKHFKAERPKIFSFDTETDGLNIKHNKPFLLVFGYMTNNFEEIHTYALDLENTDKDTKKDTLYVFHKILNKVREITGANTTFDMHMMDNINESIQTNTLITDIQIYIRLTHKALQQHEGGPPLDLLGYAQRYIDKNAKLRQRPLKSEIKRKKQRATQALKEKLKECSIPEKFKVSGKEKQWTMAMLNNFFEDKTNEIEDLPEDVAEVFKQWKKEHPRADNYKYLNRENVIEYAHYDIVYNLKIWHKLKNDIKEMQQEEAFKTEVDLIPALYTLEKTGMYFNTEYAYETKQKTKEYILKLRKKFKEKISADITVNQHEKIKNIMLEKYQINFSSVDMNRLKKAKENNEIPKEVKDIIDIILKLRSLEKWYSTYIIRWIEEAEKYGNILYPTYMATGTVTGRISSDFQQFPREALKTIEGEELFHARKLIKVPDNYYMVFFDYAAMEMRLLAIYTLLIADGDKNLCRVFKPFKCIRKQNTWYLEESPDEEWKPLDPHALTTKNAFEIDETHEKFKKYRYYGKRANFAIIYGATGNTLSSILNLSNKAGNSLYQGFFKAFPKVQNYIQYVQNHIHTYGYAENLFGRKYYGINAHKARNYLIQGSGADYTKKLLPELVKLLKETKSKIQGYLHDEFSFLIHKSETHLIPKIKQIMEQLESEIEMTVDVEYSETTWRDKHVWTKN